METATVNSGRSQVLLFAFPKPGHLAPMIQFSKRLVSKGLRITFLTTSSATQYLRIDLPPQIDLQIISEDPEISDAAPDLEVEFQRFKATVSKNLAEFIGKIMTASETPPKIIVYDSLMPWASDVARGLGLEAAPFFTQSLAVNYILYHVYRGTLRIPPEDQATVQLPSLPVLRVEDLPSFPYADPKVVLNFMTSQFSTFDDAKWIFVNTFDQLECEVANWMVKTWPIKTFGPTIPSAYLDRRLEDDRDYGLHLLNSIDTKSTLEWLDSKETDSVIYITFGSMAILEEEQVHEMAFCLRENNFSFLWALKDSEITKLPDNFVRETSDRGLVVNWCLQLEVLAHKAVGCFVTHCGWNSTLEALSLGVPMVAIPQWIDQTTNAKFVAEIWGVGVRVKMNEKRIAIKEEIETSIRHVVEGEKRDDIKRNVMKWKELAKEAVDEGGSSDNNIEEFVKAIA